MKILITGATGFVGGEIINKLHSGGFDVTGLSRNSGIRSAHRILKADITDVRDLNEKVSENFDAVIHSAGLAHQFGNIDGSLFENVNVAGTKNVSELAVRVKAKQFILISSTAVYGSHAGEIDENSECRPETVYAKSKLDAEILCREICERNNLALTIFRLSPVLGEKGIGNVPRLIGAIDGRKFIWVGDGKNKKSLIYVGDIADACRTVLTNKKGKTEIFNLSARPTEMRELVAVISKSLGKNVPPVKIPESIPRIFFSAAGKVFKSKSFERLTKVFDKWLTDDVYLSEKIEAEYGFTAKTPIADAVKKQCEWYSKQKKS